MSTTGAPPHPHPPSTSSGSPAPRLSMRQGAVALRGIARFIRRIRSQRMGGAGKTAQKEKEQQSQQSSAVKRASKRGRRTGEKDVHKCAPKLMEKLKRETSFNRNEIEALYKIYRKLITFNKSTPHKANTMNTSGSSMMTTTGVSTLSSEGIDRTVFREVLHNTFDIVTENMLMDRIFCVWDRSNCGQIALESWFLGMALFLRGTVRKQIEYCFAVYDLNGDGFLTKDEMFQLLRNCLIKFPQEEDPEESVKDLVDIVIRKMDKDKDGRVSLQDYKDTVAGEPLLMEAFGRCLPTERAKLTFLATLKF